MINRIEQGYNEIKKWKERFDKLFSSEVTDSRAIKLEQLSMYEGLLRRYRRLSPEEKSYKRRVRQEKRLLERSLYPNPLVRLARRGIVDSVYLLGRAARLFAGGSATDKLGLLKQNFERRGFGSLYPQAQKRIVQGESNFTVEQVEAISEKERLTYGLVVGQNAKGMPVLESILVRAQGENGYTHTFHFDPDRGMDRQQLQALACGRAVNTQERQWKMADYNDRDPSGNVRIREINIPDFDMVAELKKLPLQRSSIDKSQEIAQGLQQGRRMACTVMVDNQPQQLEIEALPLKHGFQLYKEGRKFSLEKAVEHKTTTEGKVRKLEVKQNRGSQKLGRH